MNKSTTTLLPPDHRETQHRRVIATLCCNHVISNDLFVIMCFCNVKYIQSIIIHAYICTTRKQPTYIHWWPFDLTSNDHHMLKRHFKDDPLQSTNNHHKYPIDT